MASITLDAKIRDVHTRIQKERKMIEGFKAMSQATSNPDTQKSCQSKIRDSEKSIQWFEQSLRELQKKRGAGSSASSPAASLAGSGGDVPGSPASTMSRLGGLMTRGSSESSSPSMSGDGSMVESSSSLASNRAPSSASLLSNNSAASSATTSMGVMSNAPRKVLPPTPGAAPGQDGQGYGAGAGQWGTGYSPSMRRKAAFTNLDLIKYDTPLNSAKISKMLNQLEFKLRVEKEYMQGIEKMAKLYQVEGDKKARSDAEAKRIESKGKRDLLEAALKRYKTLDIMGGVFDEEDFGDDDDAKGLRRKPVSGALQITVKAARDLDHLPSNKRKPTETSVVVKVEDTPRARTHPSRTDRWHEEFEIHVDKANEVEVTIYDKPAGADPPTPIGMLWIRLSDVVDELRRRKVGAEAGAGWVTAAGMEGGAPQQPSAAGHGHSGSIGGALDTPVAAHLPPNAQSAALRPGTAVDGIDAWFSVEPAGQIDLHLSFIKSNVRKRPFDAGGLGRQGAVRKRKEEIIEQNGHKFIQKQFYGVVLCAFCQEFLLKGAGMQCEDCRYSCHKKCYDKVVTKCVSKSNAEADKDGDKINHRIPHRFEPITSMSPSWCCHCGQIVPLSRKKARKCTECGLSCHADCAHLVPDFCGMSMEMARQLIGDIRTIKQSRTGPASGGLGAGRQSILPPQPALPSIPGAGRQVPPSPNRIPPPPRTASVPNITEDAKRMQIDQRKPDYQQQQQRIPPTQIQQGQAPYPHDQRQLQQPGQSLPERLGAGLGPGPSSSLIPQAGQRQQIPPPRVPNQYPLPSSAQQQQQQPPLSHGRQPSYTTGLPPGAAPHVHPGQSEQGRPQPPTGYGASQPQQPYPQTQGPRPMSGVGGQGGIQAQLSQQIQQQPQQVVNNQGPQPMQVDQRMPPSQGMQPPSTQQKPLPPQQRQSYTQPGQPQGQAGPGFPGPGAGQAQQQQQVPSVPSTPTKAKPPSSVPGTPSTSAAGLSIQQQQQQQQQQIQQQASVAAAAMASRRVGLDDFNFLAVLGKGNFGKVMLAEEKRSSRLWAIKVLKKEFIIENDEIESTKSEKRVFLAAARERHPFLLDLHSCFQTETRIYFVMEYISGGDLMLHIQREQFTPRRARFYAAEVLLALEYFHKQGIVYRDLKLDNILLTLDGHVKVADYGLCKENMWYGKTTSTFCGTPEFMAPEILLEQRYGRAVDWWAFGVLIYEMLLGQSPFRGDDEDEIFDAILEDEPLYPIHMPRASVSILQQLLCRDPTRRLGSGPDDAEEIKGHLFFKDVNWDDIMNKRVPAPYYPTISGPLDTRNFDAEFTSEQPTLTPVHSQLSAQDQREFKDFSWVGPAALGA